MLRNMCVEDGFYEPDVKLMQINMTSEEKKVNV
jgi:hypothetical protein